MQTMSVTYFTEWLAKAKRGDRAEYHLGFLAVDRTFTAYIGTREITLFNVPVNSMGEAAWQAHLAGKVALFQMKIADGYFGYLAVKL